MKKFEYHAVARTSGCLRLHFRPRTARLIPQACIDAALIMPRLVTTRTLKIPEDWGPASNMDTTLLGSHVVQIALENNHEQFPVKVWLRLLTDCSNRQTPP